MKSFEDSDFSRSAEAAKNASPEPPPAQFYILINLFMKFLLRDGGLCFFPFMASGTWCGPYLSRS
jgi:hypothetical protein